MHLKALLIIACCLRSCMAEFAGVAIITDTSVTATFSSSVCNSLTTSCLSAATTVTKTSTLISIANSSTTSTASNLSTTTTMVTISTSISPSTYQNTTIITSSTSDTVLTSILIATGTPILPTITSYSVIAPNGLNTATSTPSTQNAGSRYGLSRSGVAMMALGLSSLFWV